MLKLDIVWRDDETSHRKIYYKNECDCAFDKHEFLNLSKEEIREELQIITNRAVDEIMEFYQSHDPNDF